MAAAADWLKGGDVTLESEKQSDLGYEFGRRTEHTDEPDVGVGEARRHQAEIST